MEITSYTDIVIKFIYKALSSMNIVHDDYNNIVLRMSNDTIKKLCSEYDISLEYVLKLNDIRFIGYKVEVIDNFPDNRIDIIDISNNRLIDLSNER